MSTHQASYRSPWLPYLTQKQSPQKSETPELSLNESTQSLRVRACQLTEEEQFQDAGEIIDQIRRFQHASQPV